MLKHGRENKMQKSILATFEWKYELSFAMFPAGVYGVKGMFRLQSMHRGNEYANCWFNLLLRRATGDQNTLGRKTISKNLSTDIYLPAKKMLCCYVEKNIEWWQKSHAMDISSKIGRLRKERSLRTAQHELKNKQLQHNPSTLYETSRFTFNHIITMFCDFGFGVRWASS